MNDEIRKGAWISSTKKHLDRLQYSPEVAQFAATEISGKAANLLALLQSNEKERVSAAALTTYFVSAGIRLGERETVLKRLEEEERIEVRATGGKLEGVDVYTFAREEVLRAASRIFDKADPTVNEVAAIEALEQTCLLPRFESELNRAPHQRGI
jgi:hypothetical protein